MSITKCGKRTFRATAPQYCPKCGDQVFYWAHDTESIGTSGAHYCAEHSSYSWVYLNRDGTTHLCATTHPGGADWPLEHIGRDPRGKSDTDDEPNHASDAAIAAALNAGMAAGEFQAASNGNGHDLNTVVFGSSAAEAAPDSDRLRAMQLLIDALTPKAAVDEDAVLALIHRELAAIGAMPFTVQVKNLSTGEVNKVNGAANKALPDVIAIASAGFNPMMVGPMGTGKSYVAKQVSQALGVGIREISLTPQTSKSDLFGYMAAGGQYVASALYDWWTNPDGGVFHFDEFDNGHPSIMAGINAIIAKLQDGPDAEFDFPCGRVRIGAGRHVAIASANTYGRGPDRQYLRQPLDAATLDRFEMVPVEYDETLERTVCLNTGLDKAKVDVVLRFVRHLRKQAETKKMPLPFGMRRSHAVCGLLANGMKPSKAVEYSVRRGITDTDWASVNAGAPGFLSD